MESPLWTSTECVNRHGSSSTASNHRLRHASAFALSKTRKQASNYTIPQAASDSAISLTDNARACLCPSGLEPRRLLEGCHHRNHIQL
jgi:hypothetical protein